MKTVGYRELFRYLDQELTLEEAVDLIKRNSRKFARKQITWFRKKDRYQWITSDYTRQVISTTEKQLERDRDPEMGQ
jgi:tRNA dimethylallyltransferase